MPPATGARLHIRFEPCGRGVLAPVVTVLESNGRLTCRGDSTFFSSATARALCCVRAPNAGCHTQAKSPDASVSRIREAI